jgi:predicted GTPase
MTEDHRESNQPPRPSGGGTSYDGTGVADNSTATLPVSAGLDQEPSRISIDDILGLAEETLKSCEADGGLRRALDHLRVRLATGQLQLAVLGQFKRGKSTVINALLGSAVLPTGAIPLTAMATFIAWSPRSFARITFKTQRSPEELHSENPDTIRKFLGRFATEESNPKNRLGVDRVDLFFRSHLLANGTILIDTPGVGSTHRHNTDAAIQILPECDAALFVVSADPPITQIELDYLLQLQKKVSRIFFVVNKIDYLDTEDSVQVTDFLRTVLAEKLKFTSPVQIFCVSARNGLQAKQAGDREALSKSGISALESYLTQHLADEKRSTLRSAARIKGVELLSQAVSDLQFRIRTLQIPFEDLAVKRTIFASGLQNIKEQRELLPDILSGSKRQLVEMLESRIALLRTDTLKKFAKYVDGALLESNLNARNSVLQEELGVVISETFDQAESAFRDSFTAAVDLALTRLIERIELQVDTVRKAAGDLFNIPLFAHISSPSLHIKVEPYWITERDNPAIIPDAARYLERVLPPSFRRRRLRARIFRDLNEIVVRNAENLRWSFHRALSEIFIKAEAELEKRIDSAVSTTQGAIEAAFKLRQDRLFTAEPEIDRLTQAMTSLRALGVSLAHEAS